MQIEQDIAMTSRTGTVSLRFNHLLCDAGVEPAATRLLRHQTRLGDGRTPIDLWRSDPALLDAYQSYQLTAYRAYFEALWWASFVGTADGRTLFVGLVQVGEPTLVTDDAASFPSWLRVTPGRDDHYPLHRADALSEYVGRLFVDWGGGTSGKRAWRQRADTQNKAITELHLDVAGQPFPGLLNINEALSVLTAAPPLWIAQLEAARGVYLLTCPATGALYVGSATGEGGFWNRWSSYIANGHGGNVALRDRERTDWVASVLQVAGSADSDEDVLAMEALWKRKLQSRTFGLNRNG